MSKARVDIGFSSDLDEFNPADWKPTKTGAADRPPRPPKDLTEQAAAVAGFKSREPVTPVSSPSFSDMAPVRRRRTGRNAQFNLKAKPETIAAFCEVADRHNWGLGETLEKAVELLLERYK